MIQFGILIPDLKQVCIIVIKQKILIENSIPTIKAYLLTHPHLLWEQLSNGKILYAGEQYEDFINNLNIVTVVNSFQIGF